MFYQNQKEENTMFQTFQKTILQLTLFLIVTAMIFQSCADTTQGSVKTIQVVNFNLEGITHDDFMGVANEVAPNFAPLSGLVTKVWLSDKENNTYGGIYSWEGQEACNAYRGGELYAGALANNSNFVNLYDKSFNVLEGPSNVTGNLSQKTPKYIQVVNFNLEGITHDDFMGVANEVAPNFAKLPGLISKVWLSDKASNTYGGVYSWDSQEACVAYRGGELYAGALANNPSFVNLSDNGFSVLDGPSKVTHMK